MSARHTDSLFRIRDPSVDPAEDPTAGTVVARYGGVASTVAFPDADTGHPAPAMAAQHDARLDADGFLSFFDNRTPWPGRDLDDTAARAVRYQVVDGQAALVGDVRHPEGEQSSCLGSARWQPTGSVVVAWGCVSVGQWGEYGPDGTTLLEVTLESGFPYRVAKEPPAAFGRDQLRATAGMPTSTVVAPEAVTDARATTPAELLFG